LGTHFSEFVEPVAKLCLEKLLTDNYSYLRKEGAKCMRFCIAACHGNPEHQRRLFLETYVRLMANLEMERNKEDEIDFEKVNMILKELHKQLRNFIYFKDIGVTIFQQ